MVFIFHMGYLSDYQLGSAGVQFFFILSGFILTFSYHSRFDVMNRITLKKFYLARFAKVYPVHVLTFIISAPLVVITFNPDGLYLIKLAYMSAVNLFLVQSFIPFGYFNFNGVSWTLSVEAFFYLTFPFLLWIFNSKYKVKENIKKSVVILLMVWIIMFLFNMNLAEDNSILIWLLHIFPVARLFEFSTGIVLGLIFVSRLDIPVNSTMLSVLESLSIILFFISIAGSVYLDVGIVRGVYFVPLWCLLIYTFAFQKGIFSRVLSHRYLVYLGEISFSFYMIHQLVIRYFSYMNLNTYINLMICTILSLVLSALMYHFYEEALRKRIRYGSTKLKTSTLENSTASKAKIS